MEVESDSLADKWKAEKQLLTSNIVSERPEVEPSEDNPAVDPSEDNLAVDPRITNNGSFKSQITKSFSPFYTVSTEVTNTGTINNYSDIGNELRPIAVNDVDIMIETNLHTLYLNSSEPFESFKNESLADLRRLSEGTDFFPLNKDATNNSTPIDVKFERILPKSQYKERKRKESRSRKNSFSKEYITESSQSNNSYNADKSFSHIQALPLYQRNEYTDGPSTVANNMESSTASSSPFQVQGNNKSKLYSSDEFHVVVAHSRSRIKPNLEETHSKTEVSTINPLTWKHHPSSRSPPSSRTSRTDSYGSNLGSHRPIIKHSNDKGPTQLKSVCHNDPCGAGVACHPVGTEFECVCSDDTKVLPHEPCPDIGTVDYTPPAKSMPQGNEALTKPSQSLLLGIVVTLSLIAFVFLALFYWKRKKIGKLFRQSNALKFNKNSNDSLSKMSTLLHTYNFANNPNYYTSPPDELPLHALSVQLISKDEIKFIGDLGEGCFGRVYKGEYQTKDGVTLGDSISECGSICSYSDDPESGESVDSLKKVKEPKSGRKRIVAVKVLKELVGMEAEADFMREVEIMSSFRHPNILSLIGVVVADTGGTPWMVFEFMPYGDLAEVLRSCNKQFSKNYMPMNSLNKIELLNICSQVAAGMEYLSLQHFVHRDLACRNCLVGRNLTVKISDFGMSRDVYTCDYYKVGGSRMLPVRWMAPESILYGKFTLESDVWSFGVVLWEVYSFGKQPYYGNSNEEVVQLILQGILLSPCESCPPLVREIMRLCWSTEPHNRLNFQDIVERLLHAKKVLMDSSEDDFVQDILREINYSPLSSHDTLEKFTLDHDQYLIPKCTPVPKDEYLTVLQG